MSHRLQVPDNEGSEMWRLTLIHVKWIRLRSLLYAWYNLCCGPSHYRPPWPKTTTLTFICLQRLLKRIISELKEIVLKSRRMILLFVISFSVVVWEHHELTTFTAPNNTLETSCSVTCNLGVEMRADDRRTKWYLHQSSRDSAGLRIMLARNFVIPAAIRHCFIRNNADTSRHKPTGTGNSRWQSKTGTCSCLMLIEAG